MKKLSYYIAVLLTFALGACTEDYNENVKPQTNPEEGTQSYEGLTVELGQDFKSAIDLSTQEATATLEAIIATATPELGENARMDYVLQVSNTAGFETMKEFEIGSGNELEITPLNVAYRELFGKSPNAQDMHIRFRAYIAEGTARVRLGDYFLTTTLTVTPIPMDLPTIEEAYYLIGDPTGWNATDKSTLIKFEHSGKDVYEDPVFTLLLDAKANNHWKIIPQSGIDAVEAGTATDFWPSQIGVETNGDVSLEGMLIKMTSAGAQKLTEDGKYLITINMMEETYKVERLPDVQAIAIRGDYTGWDFFKSQKIYSTNGTIYTGTIYFDGKAANGWKLCEDADWVVSWGADSESTTPTNPASLTLSGGSNIKDFDKNCYVYEFNKTSKELKVIRSYTSWGVVGAHNEWGGTPDVLMTYTTEDEGKTHYLTATLDIAAGADWKLRPDNAWDIGEASPGNTIGNAIANGVNFKVEEAGNYTIKWYFNELHQESDKVLSRLTITKN